MFSIEESDLNQMKSRYNHVQPLIFQRSVEHAKSIGDLFDILEALPVNELPLIWDESVRKWVVTSDLTQASKFNFEEKP